MTDTAATPSGLHANIRQLRSLVRGIRAIAPRAVAARMLDREQGWTAPFRIADSGGLYLGRDGAWLYCEIPTEALRPADDSKYPLDALLRDLAQQGAARNVHLLIHAWEEQARVPAGTPAGLADYLAESHTFFVPTRRLLLGVRLNKSADAARAESGTVATALGIVDTLLGETFPDLTAYDADRKLVNDVLRRYRATPPAQDAVGHLENWYTLGAFADVTATELDDVVALDGGGTIEMLAAAGLNPAGNGPARALESAGGHGATVASVRGRLNLPGRSAAGSGNRRESTGTLSGASVIVGRRSVGRDVPWGVGLRTHPGLVQRPLPMRQLDALDETLPCSTRRMSPTLTRLGTAHLRSAGFADTRQLGDDVGLFVGLASPGFAYPFYLNPTGSGTAPVTLITGGAGSGKTFTAEHLARQAVAAGMRVAYLAAFRDAGQGLAELTGADAVDVEEPAALSPYRWLPGRRAHEVVQHLIALLLPELDGQDLRDLDAGFRRSAAVGRYSIEAALELTDGAAAAAKVLRSIRRTPLLGAALTDPPAGLPDADGRLSVVLAHVGKALTLRGERAAGDDAAVDAVLADLAGAVLIEHAAIRPGAGGALVVLDGAWHHLRGPLTDAALDRVARLPGAVVHVLACTRYAVDVADSSLFRYVGRVLALAERDEAAAKAALALVGLPSDDAHVAWLGTAEPDLTSGIVVRSALAVHKDRLGRTASVLIGPVPDSTLGALTHHRAEHYPGHDAT